MTRSIEIGAPSLTGKDANDLVAEVFGDATFPLKVVAQNLMPRNVVFPEVPGLFLRHVSNAKDSQAAVEIASLDLFHRVASSVEQIAELNRYKSALTFTEVEASTPATDAAAATTQAKASGKRAKAAAAATDTDTGAGADTGSGTDGSANAGADAGTDNANGAGDAPAGDDTKATDTSAQGDAQGDKSGAAA